MSNILEYLDWRGDISFEVSPFNEVDNLILAEICYTDFEGVMTQDDTLSVVDASRIYFEIHSEEEILGRDTFYKLAPLVMKKAAESERFRGMVLKNYINLISVSREEQYSAITFVLPNGLTYVAFRGTDNTIVGWREDFNLSFMNETAGQRRAVEYINYYFGGSGTKNSLDSDKTLKKNLILGGHSKGGNFAVYAAAFCDPEIQKSILNVYSNDGPGFRDEILEKDSYKNILPRIVSILPEESMVGILLSNEYDNKIIKSEAHGIGQHDPLNWQVYGTSFVEATKRAEISKVIDKTMVEWLSEMSDEDRAVFTESVFSTLDTTGAKTLNELSEGGVKIISEILRSVKEMPADKQAELSAMVKRFIKIGSDIAVAELKDKAKHVKKSLPKANIPSLPGSSTSLVTEDTKSKKIRAVNRESAKRKQKSISDERLKEEKNKLRKEIYDIRKSMVDTEVIQKSFAICKKLMSMNIYKDSDIVLAYMSIDNEVDLSYLISKAIEEGKKVYIPKVRTKTKMDFYLYDGSFNIGKYGIREPASKSKFDAAELLMGEERKKVLLLMPGVVFDKSRNRIGHGGGFYDRYLESVNRISISVDGDKSGQVTSEGESSEKNVFASEYIFKAAVCYDYQIKASVPHDRRDKKVDTIITETKVL